MKQLAGSLATTRRAKRGAGGEAMSTDEIMVAVRLATAVVLWLKAVMFFYAFMTHDPARTFTEQWPVIRPLKSVILLGLCMGSLGWAVHQTWWLPWQMAMAYGARDVARSFELMSLYLLPAHVAIVVGGAAVVSPMSSVLLGPHWPKMVAGILVAFACLGVALVRL